MRYVVKNIETNRYYANGHCKPGKSIRTTSMLNRATKFDTAKLAKRKALAMNIILDSAFVNKKTGQFSDHAAWQVRVIGLCGGSSRR